MSLSGMIMEKLYDITEVCRLFGVSSRTLRYYEEKGLIQSTTDAFSKRRRYTEEQLNTIREVRILRSLGLPLARIAALQDSEAGLGDCIAEHRAQLAALISEKAAEINLLEEALARIQQGEDILALKPAGDEAGKADQGGTEAAGQAGGTGAGEPTGAPDKNFAIACTDEQLRIAGECTDAILGGNFARLFRYSSEDIRHLINESELRYGWERMEKVVGAFAGKGEMVRDSQFPNCVYQYLHYEKLDVRVKFVFHGEVICGFWHTYVRKPEQGTEIR